MKYARLEVRILTHTLHMPPALSEIYDGPRPGWLREVLEYLPCLQSLIVSGLPFFDHNAMMALKGPGGCEKQGEEVAARTYNIHLLLAEREPNTTSQGLAETLVRFPALIYLDLSYTVPARSHAVLSALSQLEHLQVLKLRGIGLKDNDAEFLANAIGTRVRFLDLRNNYLTDMALRSLLQASFLPAESRGSGQTWVRSSTISQPVPDLSSSDFLRRPELDEQFVELLTRPLTGGSWVGNLPHVGITHLYIADNPITVEGVASLLASTRLHALDVGTVDTAESIARGARLASSCSRADNSSFPGAEKLIPILGSCAKDNLAYLRVHHAVVTADAPIRDAPLAALLPELPAERAHGELGPTGEAELDFANEVHELPSSKVEPRFELADTSIARPATSLPYSPAEKRVTSAGFEDEALPERRRGSVFAPEVVEQDQSEVNDSTVLNARRTGLSSGSSQTAENTLSCASTDIASAYSKFPELHSPCSSLAPAGDPRSQRIQELLAKRPHNETLPVRDSRDSNFPYFHPSHVPHLETLVLTDVPSHVPQDSQILKSVTRFITACSNEALLATLQAGSDYSLPPGQARLRAEQQRSRSLFALRHLVLEITPVPSGKGATKLTSWKPANYQNGTWRSSAGDRDSENLWSAAMNDFSFFGNEECGIPDNDPGKYFPMAVLNEKVTLMPEDYDNFKHPETPELESPVPPIPAAARGQGHHRAFSSASNTGQPNNIQLSGNQEQMQRPEVDLVAELAAFRRAKKAEYEGLVRTDRRKRRNTNATTTTITSPSSSTFSPLSPLTSSLPPPSPSPSLTPTPLLSMAYYVEGYWKGEVKVVRNAAPKGRSGVVDMYGNYFEKGYLYP